MSARRVLAILTGLALVLLPLLGWALRARARRAAAAPEDCGSADGLDELFTPAP